MSVRKKIQTGFVVLGIAAGSIASPACAEKLQVVSRDAQIMHVLDQYLDALNALDMEAHVATYHFPHYRHASGVIAVWHTPLEAMPILNVPKAERRARIRDALAPDWHRSAWTRRDIVQADDTKVHVVTTFVRLREDGGQIASYDSLYVLTYQDDRWAIKGRSSFAP
jgi:hypothetical protein